MWLKIISWLEKVLGRESLIAQKKFVELCIFIGPIIAKPCPLTDSLLMKKYLPQVLHRLQNKEKPIRTTFTLRFGSLKMIFECSIARCDEGLGRAIVQCQKNPLRKPKLSINRAILSAHFSAVKFCIGFFCWIGFFWFCIGFFCNWMLQLLLKIVAKNLNYASLHVCT